MREEGREREVIGFIMGRSVTGFDMGREKKGRSVTGLLMGRLDR